MSSHDNLASGKTSGRGPLAGYRVLELGSTVAGPFCARLLADFGANVIKVEQKDGDAVRAMGKIKQGRSLYGASILRNKRIISVDLHMPQGREIVKRLCARADIVVENFRPGTLERWGLGYPVLKAQNPGVVLVRISGYGQDGPYSQRPGYGVVCEAFSGLRELTGDPDRPPARVSVSLTDDITGLYAAFGAVMAVLERNRSGEGQVVDAALYEAAFSFMEPHIPAFQQLGVVATRTGSRLPNHTPNTLYTSADGRHIHITAGSQSVFRRLAQAMGRPELLEDQRFSTPVARSAHEDEVDEVVGAWVGSLPLAEVELQLDRAGVPASRIFNIRDIFDDPHYRARGMVATPKDSVLGPVAMANVVPRLSRTPGEIAWAGHDAGEDTVQILRDELDMPEVQIQALLRDKIVHDATAECSVMAAGDQS